MAVKTVMLTFLLTLSPLTLAATLTIPTQTHQIQHALQQKGTWFTQNAYQFSDVPFEYSEPLAMLNPMCWKPAIDIACNDKVDATEVRFMLHKKQSLDALVEGKCIIVWYLNLDAQLNVNQLASREKINWRFDQDQDNITTYKHVLEISDCEILDDPILDINDHVYTGRTPLDAIQSGFIRHHWKTNTKLKFD